VDRPVFAKSSNETGWQQSHRITGDPFFYFRPAPKSSRSMCLSLAKILPYVDTFEISDNQL
jgi:hypothetical protein